MTDYITRLHYEPCHGLVCDRFKGWGGGGVGWDVAHVLAKQLTFEEGKTNLSD